MIYITDNMSIQMFENKTYTLKTKKIKKSKMLQNTKNAITSIGSSRIAKALHKKVGKKEIRLQPGDELYVVTSKFGRNKTDYKKENSFRYQVFEVETP